jgi:ribosome recycling factor
MTQQRWPNESNAARHHPTRLRCELPDAISRTAGRHMLPHTRTPADTQTRTRKPPMSDPDTILLEAEDSMSKAIEYLTSELRGIRAGRATPSMVEFIKIDCYGSRADLKSIAAISTPEPTQILIKPFDTSLSGAIREGIERAGLGFNPIVEAKQVRISVPSLSTDRRKQLASQAKKVGEEQKIVCRNTRRDANKAADALEGISEDEQKTLKNEIQELLKKYEARIDELIEKKAKEISEV